MMVPERLRRVLQELRPAVLRPQRALRKALHGQAGVNVGMTPKRRAEIAASLLRQVERRRQLPAQHAARGVLTLRLKAALPAVARIVLNAQPSRSGNHHQPQAGRVLTRLQPKPRNPVVATVPVAKLGLPPVAATQGAAVLKLRRARVRVDVKVVAAAPKKIMRRVTGAELAVAAPQAPAAPAVLNRA